MAVIGYKRLRFITLLLHIFPLRFLFILSDIVYYFAFYIFKHKRSLIASNLTRAFPTYSQKEQDEIARKYYKHKYDTYAEIAYYDRIRKANGNKYLKFTNPDVVNSYLDSGRNVMFLFGNYNNPSLTFHWPLNSAHKYIPIYKRSHKSYVDKFFVRLMGKFGGFPSEKSAANRVIINNHLKKIPVICSSLFDLSSSSQLIDFKQQFLNQLVTWALEPEKLAQKINAVVFHLAISKIKRGYYEAKFELITDQAEESPDTEIISKCIRLLESDILENPEFYNWTTARLKNRIVNLPNKV